MTGDDSKRRRTIRSFVKRAGRLTLSQRRALEELWPEWGIEYSSATLDLDALFGRRAPRVLEIGFGNGDSLATMAAQRALENAGVEAGDLDAGTAKALRNTYRSELRRLEEALLAPLDAVVEVGHHPDHREQTGHGSSESYV